MNLRLGNESPTTSRPKRSLPCCILPNQRPSPAPYWQLLTRLYTPSLTPHRAICSKPYMCGEATSPPPTPHPGGIPGSANFGNKTPPGSGSAAGKASPHPSPRRFRSSWPPPQKVLHPVTPWLRPTLEHLTKRLPARHQSPTRSPRRPPHHLPHGNPPPAPPWAPGKEKNGTYQAPGLSYFGHFSRGYLGT